MLALNAIRCTSVLYLSPGKSRSSQSTVRFRGRVLTSTFHFRRQDVFVLLITLTAMWIVHRAVSAGMFRPHETCLSSHNSLLLLLRAPCFSILANKIRTCTYKRRGRFHLLSRCVGGDQIRSTTPTAAMNHCSSQGQSSH